MGALDGLRVIEMAGIGPAPFCGMLLADMGADVLRIDRLAATELGVPIPPRYDLLNRNKRSAAVDLKSEAGLATVRDLLGRADVLIEGFRPGVMEKLGLGPDQALAINPRLVYGRMTGWGQDGPLNQAAGHDLNYIALAGALNSIGRSDEAPPAIPLNLLGDFGGGALYLAMGVLAAVIEARGSGRGQVVDTAIVDGVANLLAMQYSFKQMGWPEARGRGILNGGAPYYDSYATKDGRYVTIAPVEGRFYRELLERLGLAGEALPAQNDRAGWCVLRARFAEVFKTRTRDEWCALLEGTDACFAPVLDMDECVVHPHNAARQVFAELDGVLHPQPAPRFSRTPSALRRPPPAAGADTAEVLADWGLAPERIVAMRASGFIA